MKTILRVVQVLMLANVINSVACIYQLAHKQIVVSNPQHLALFLMFTMLTSTFLYFQLGESINKIK